jgi:mitotic spindle assembly checkpoint protein MAD2B
LLSIVDQLPNKVDEIATEQRTHEMMEIFKSIEELTETLTAFYEAALHTILCVRQVYPCELFEKRQLLGVSVWRCRHPLVIDYINQALGSVKPILVDKAIDQIIFVIKRSPNQLICEQYVFACKWIFGLLHDKDVAKIDRHDLECALQSFLLKVAMSDSFLRAILGERTFEIIIRAGASVQKYTPKKFPWVPLIVQTDVPIDTDTKRTSLKDYKCSSLHMQLYVEEVGVV